MIYTLLLRRPVELYQQARIEIEAENEGDAMAAALVIAEEQELDWQLSTSGKIWTNAEPQIESCEVLLTGTEPLDL